MNERVRDRIGHISRTAMLIRKSPANRSRSEVEADLILRAALERWLDLIGEASRHMPGTLKAEYPKVPWRSIRDLLRMIHEIHLDPSWSRSSG